MAPVSRDRAQLLLVGGLVIAVGLVGLAIVLNSGIYTHNLASRADPIASEAAGHTAVVRDSVGGLVEFAVRQHPDREGEQVHNVTAGVSNVSDLLAREAAGRAVLTNATVAATTNGTKVNQTAETGDRAFTSAAVDYDWEVVTGAEGIRAFRMDVRRTSLDDHAGVTFGDFTGDEFNVTFAPSSGDDWNVSVYRDSGTDTTIVTVTNVDTGRSFGPCTDDTGSRTEIDVTDATVAGEPCDALRRLDALATPFDLEFHNAGEAEGSYGLVVVDALDVDDTNLADAGDPGPSELDTLYSVDVVVRFRSQRVDFRTTITVAPGELDG